jgi:hypothetical protein
MADVNSLVDLQNSAVLCLANAAAGGWDRLVVNFEIAELDEGSTRNAIALRFCKQGPGWRRDSFIVPHECCNLLAQLFETMVGNGGRPWGSCTVEIDPSGQYKYTFSYEPPKRLNDVFDDDATFKKYVPRPL